MDVKDLIASYINWISQDENSVVSLRLQNEEKGREWVYKILGYNQELTLQEFQTYFNRLDQNDEYVVRYDNRDISSKKPPGYYQTEINAIYSFHKCFAMRNNTRLQYYRHDLSQKGARNMTAINNGLGKFIHLSAVAENPTS